jgi:predicted GNAT family N-acyltransferase
MIFTIKQPETETESTQYYKLRWRILRAPWHEAEGSEKDDLENDCHHVMACDDNGSVMGVGRLQFNSATEAQIRYMAVEPDYEARGIGRAIVNALEQIAQNNHRNTIVLDAREPAVGFYAKLGYEVTGKSYLLFNCIQHFRMQKMF